MPMRAIVALLLLSAPLPGATVMKQTVVEVYCPTDCRSQLADAGAVVTWSGSSGNYGTVTSRWWYYSDGGLGSGPNWPDSLVPLDTVSTVALCANSAVCKAYSGAVDSAVDAFASSPSFCAVDATCKFSDAGVVPVGRTWTGVAHSGNCQTKPTVDLFLSGNDSSWPLACPLQ